MKICKFHGELSEKNTYIGHSRGHKYIRCKLCKADYHKKNNIKKREQMKEYHKKYRELNLLRLRQYYTDNKEKRNKKCKEWSEKNKGRWIRSQHGILFTNNDYIKLMEIQNNVCAICKNPEKILSRKRDKIKSLSIDHCHKTNKIRGLLCHHCNVALGSFNDSIELLQSAIQYLKSTTE